MAEWFNQVRMFGSAVTAHWISLVTGGLLTALIGAVEHKRNQNVSWKSYILFLSAFLLYAVFASWQDEHRNTESVKSEKAAFASLYNSCDQRQQIANAYTRGLETANLSERVAIDASQKLINSQQQSISQCVVSLGKMNPKVREDIVVVALPMVSVDSKGRTANQFTFIRKYVFFVVVTTNETEPRFHGFIKCGTSFLPISAPQLPGTSQTTLVAMARPSRVSDNEYEISATANGSEWSPSHPAYFTATSDSERLEPCTFRPF